MTALSRFDLSATLDTIDKLAGRLLNEAPEESHDVLHAISMIAEKTKQDVLAAKEIVLD